VQHEREPLGGCQGVEDHDQGEADRVGQQGFLVGVDVVVGAHDGIGQAGVERLFGPRSARAQHVQAHPADHRGEPAAQVLDPMGVGPGQPDPGLLDGIVGLAQ
jgi:hypothetical protein